MKYTIICFLTYLCFLYVKLPAQTSCGISYSYDNSGNRNHREPVDCGDPGPGGGGGSGKTDGTEVSSGNVVNTDELTESLFPNPTTGVTSIIFNRVVIGAELTVNDNTGRRLHSVIASGSALPLNLGSFPDGVYIVTVKAKGQEFAHSVVKN